MSIATWKKEFITCPANKCRKGLHTLRRDLKKWEGLRKANLKKHNLTCYDPYIEDDQGGSFIITSKTCGLCHNYYKDEADEPCKTCPLYKIEKTCSLDDNNPYDIWRDTGNPQPMIRALKRLIKLYQKK